MQILNSIYSYFYTPSLQETEKELAQELSQYPKLQKIMDLTLTDKFPFQWDPKLKETPQIGICGRYSLVFKQPDAKTTRCAEAVLDEMGNGSAHIDVDVEHRCNKLTPYFASSSNKNVNYVYKIDTGITKKGEVVDPVWGIAIDKKTAMIVKPNNPNHSIKALVFNNKEKKVVLAMLSYLYDIEEELESHLIAPIVDIIRSYTDWTDIVAEKRISLAIEYVINSKRDDKYLVLADALYPGSQHFDSFDITYDLLLNHERKPETKEQDS